MGEAAQVQAFVALGANLGNAAQAIADASDAIDALPGSRVIRRSSLYRSAPIDAEGPDFLNAVVELSTTLTAEGLLDHLQQIESASGRLRPYRNAPRTLDLDILLFGEDRIASPRLIVPHPRMNERAFVLLPLAEIAPDRVGHAQLQVVADQHIEKLAEPAGPS